MTKYQHHHFSLNARGIVKNLTYEAGTNNEKSPTGDARAQQEWLWMLPLATKCLRSIGRDPAVAQFDLSSRDGRNFGAVGNKN